MRKRLLGLAFGLLAIASAGILGTGALSSPDLPVLSADKYVSQIISPTGNTIFSDPSGSNQAALHDPALAIAHGATVEWSVVVSTDNTGPDSYDAVEFTDSFQLYGNGYFDHTVIDWLPHPQYDFFTSCQQAFDEGNELQWYNTIKDSLYFNEYTDLDTVLINGAPISATNLDSTICNILDTDDFSGVIIGPMGPNETRTFTFTGVYGPTEKYPQFEPRGLCNGVWVLAQSNYGDNTEFFGFGLDSPIDSPWSCVQITDTPHTTTIEKSGEIDMTTQTIDWTVTVETDIPVDTKHFQILDNPIESTGHTGPLHDNHPHGFTCEYTAQGNGVFICNVTTQITDLSSDQYCNEASVYINYVPLGSTTACVQPPMLEAPTIEVTKQAVESVISSTDTELEWLITVTTSSSDYSGDITNVVFTDSWSGYSVSEVVINPVDNDNQQVTINPSGTSFTYSVGTMGPNDSQSFLVTMTIADEKTDSPCLSGDYTFGNNVEIIDALYNHYGTDTSIAGDTDSASTVCTAPTPNPVPELILNKVEVPSITHVETGQSVDYQITVTNPAGNSGTPGVPVYNLDLTDVLSGPTGVSYTISNVSANIGTPTIVGNQINIPTIAQLLPGQTYTLTYTVTYGTAAGTAGACNLEGHTFQNVATIESFDYPTYPNVTVDGFTTVEPNQSFVEEVICYSPETPVPVIEVTKTLVEPSNGYVYAPNQNTVTYQITIDASNQPNGFTGMITDLVLTDTTNFPFQSVTVNGNSVPFSANGFFIEPSAPLQVPAGAYPSSQTYTVVFDLGTWGTDHTCLTAGQTLTNSASATGFYDANGISTTVSDTSQTVTATCHVPANISAPSLSLAKVAHADIINEGESVDYVISVFNSSDTTANNIQLEDIISNPSNGTYSISNVNAAILEIPQYNFSNNGNSISFTPFDLPANTAYTVIYTITYGNNSSNSPTACIADGIQFINTASVTSFSYTDEFGNEISDDVTLPSEETATVTCNAQTTNLEVTKELITHECPTYGLGGTGAATFGVTITNTGDLPLTDVTVYDVLQNYFTNVSNITQGVTLSGSEFSIPAGYLDNTGDTFSFQFTVDIDATQIANFGTPLTNSVSATADNVEIVDSNTVSFTCGPIVVPQPTVNINKAVANSQTTPLPYGDNSITWTLTIDSEANGYQGLITGLTLTDDPLFPVTGVTLLDASGTALPISFNGDTLTYDLPDFTAGTDFVFTLITEFDNTYDAHVCGTDGQLLQNNVTLANGFYDGNTSLPSSSDNATIPCGPVYVPTTSLEVTKELITHECPTYGLGGTGAATFEVTITNTGDLPLTNVQVTDLLNSYFTNVSNITQSVTLSGSTFSIPAGNLDNTGDTFSFQFTVDVDAAQIANFGTPLTNFVSATADNDASDTSNTVSFTCGPIVVPEPTISVAKDLATTQANPLPYGDDTITWVITVSTQGNGYTGNITDVTLTDTIDFDVQSVTVDGTPITLTGDSFTYTVGTMGPNDSQSFTVVTTYDSDSTKHICTETGQLLTNSVTVNGDYDLGTPLAPDSDDAIIMCQLPDEVAPPVLDITKSASQSVTSEGGDVIYTVQVTNTASTTATNVTLTDVLTVPANTVYVISDATDTLTGGTTTGAVSTDGTTLTFPTLTTLDAGGIYTVTYTVTYGGDDLYAPTACVEATNTFTNVAQVTGFSYTDEYNNDTTNGVTLPDPADTTVTCSAPDTALPLFDIQKSLLTPATAVEGEEITWQIIVSMPSNQPYEGNLTDLVITEDPAYAYSNPYFTDENGNITSGLTYTLDVLNPGQVVILEFTTTVGNQAAIACTADGHLLPNGVTITDIFEPTSDTLTDEANATAPCSVIPPEVPTPVINKSVNTNTVHPGQSFTYTISGNTGQFTDGSYATIDPLVITDDIESSLIEFDLDAFAAANPGITVTELNDGTYQFNLGTVTGPFSFSIEATFLEGVASGTQFCNVAHIGTLADIAADPVNAVCSDPTSACVTLVDHPPVDQPTFTISKSADVDTVMEGDTVTWTITITNTSDTDATNVTFTDNLPTGVTAVTPDFGNLTITDDSLTNGTYTATIGQIDANDSVSFTVTTTIGAGTTDDPTMCVTDGQSFTNVVSLDTFQYLVNPTTTSTINDGQTASDSVICEVPEPPVVPVDAPTFTISKSADVDTVMEGDTVTWTITITNTSDTDATNVTFTDNLPTGVTAVTPDFGNLTITDDSLTNGTYTATIGQIDANDSVSFTVTTTIGAGTTDDPTMCVTDGQSFTNVVSLDTFQYLVNPTTTSTINDGQTASDSVICEVPEPPVVPVDAPTFTISKSADVDTVMEGDTVTWTITITNTSDTDATNVTFTDNLPTGVTAVTPDFGNLTITDDSLTNGTYTATIGQIDANDSVSFTVTTTIGAGTTDDPTMCVTDGQSFTNVVTLTDFDYTDENNNTVTDHSGQTASDSVICEVPVVEYPAPTITKTDNADTVLPGGTITYTVNVDTNGATFSPLQITDNFDDHLTLIESSVTNGVTVVDQPNNTYLFDLGTVTGPTSFSFSVEVSADATPGQAICNVVHIGTPLDLQQDPEGTVCSDPESACVIVESPFIAAPSIALTKTANVTETEIGQAIIWTLTVNNDGNVPLTNVEITDPLASYLTYQSGDADISLNGSDLTITVGDLAIGQTIDYTFTTLVNGDATGLTQLSNTATVNGVYAETDTTVTDSGSDTVILVTPPAPEPELEWTVEKTSMPADGAVLNVGDLITYYITVTNEGNTALTDVFVTDDLDSSIRFHSDLGNPEISGDFFDPSVIISFPYLGVNESLTTSFQVKVVSVPDTTNQQFCNALHCGLAFGDVDSDFPYFETGDFLGGTCHTVVPEDEPTPGLEFAKTVTSGDYAVGDTVTYSVTATNTGDFPLTDVIAIDQLPAGTQFQQCNGDYDLDGSTLTLDFGTLAAGQSQTITFSVTVTQPGQFCNDIVSGQGTTPDGDTVGGTVTTGPQCETATIDDEEDEQDEEDENQEDNDDEDEEENSDSNDDDEETTTVVVVDNSDDDEDSDNEDDDSTTVVIVDNNDDDEDDEDDTNYYYNDFTNTDQPGSSSETLDIAQCHIEECPECPTVELSLTKELIGNGTVGYVADNSLADYQIQVTIDDFDANGNDITAAQLYVYDRVVCADSAHIDETQFFNPQNVTAGYSYDSTNGVYTLPVDPDDLSSGTTFTLDYSILLDIIGADTNDNEVVNVAFATLAIEAEGEARHYTVNFDTAGLDDSTFTSGGECPAQIIDALDLAAGNLASQVSNADFTSLDTSFSGSTLGNTAIAKVIKPYVDANLGGAAVYQTQAPSTDENVYHTVKSSGVESTAPANDETATAVNLTNATTSQVMSTIDVMDAKVLNGLIPGLITELESLSMIATNTQTIFGVDMHLTPNGRVAFTDQDITLSGDYALAEALTIVTTGTIKVTNNVTFTGAVPAFVQPSSGQELTVDASVTSMAGLYFLPSGVMTTTGDLTSDDPMVINGLVVVADASDFLLSHTYIGETPQSESELVAAVTFIMPDSLLTNVPPLFTDFLEREYTQAQ